MANVETTSSPVFTITLTEDEAVGLNTLLRSGTWSMLDEALGIVDLQDRLSCALDSLPGKSTKGVFTNRLDIDDLRLS